MMYPRNPYCIVYRVYGHAEVERTFQTEEDMEDYCNIYLDYPDLDYVDFFKYDVEYTPNFWKEW